MIFSGDNLLKVAEGISNVAHILRSSQAKVPEIDITLESVSTEGANLSG